MSAKSYIVKKINELPTFTGALSPDDLVAFYDISTGITHKIKVSEIGGGSLDHRDLTQESRFANDQHVMGSVVGLVDKIADLDAEDVSLQQQIFEIVENSPIDIVRFFMTTQITLLGQTYNLSSETKGVVAATPITVSVTGTDRATSNRIARFIGDTPLAVERLIPAQNTQIFIRANKNNTTRLVYIYFDFYDYAADGTTILKGSTSDVLLTDTEEVYNLLLQVAEYTAQVGARSLVDCRTYQTGTGVAAQTTISIAGDYTSRFQYKLPAGSLSFLDEKLISTQPLPSLNLLAGATQKEVNAAQDDAIEELNGRVDDVEVRMEGLEQNSSAIIPYRKYFIDIINGDDSNDGLSSDTAFKSTAILNDLLPTIAVKSVEIVLIGPSGLSDFGRIEVKNPLYLNTLIVEGYRYYGDSYVSTIEVDIVALDEFWFGGVVTGTLERIGLIKNDDWYATLKDITIWHSHNISLMYNLMTNVTFYYCSIYLKSIYSPLGARFQNCIIVGDINGLSLDSIENCLFKDSISVTQEDLDLLDSKITEAVNSIGTTINDINSSIDDINSSIGAININNEEQDLLNANHEQRLDIAEAQLAGNQLTFASIYGYYNFI